jgi:general secretion pathway protein I
VSERGSIFLETIVACAIVAMILGVTLDSIGAGARRTARLAAASGALAVAQSRLAETGIVTPLVPGETRGGEGAYRWRIDVRPFGVPGPAGTPYQVTVAVGVAGIPGLTTLQTIRLG